MNWHDIGFLAGISIIEELYGGEGVALVIVG